MAQSLHSRADFDSYFPVEDYEDQTEIDNALKSLPFPAPLHTLRRQFRDTEFECDSFLLEHQRHGQLDDLLSELRTLSKTLDQELTKGVEDDYEDFIALGKLDDRRINDLHSSISNLKKSFQDVERELHTDLSNIELVIAEKAQLDRQKREARNALCLSRTIDELSYLLHHDDDLEQAVEALEYLYFQTRATKLLDSDLARVTDLIALLTRRIKDSIADKMDRASLIRRVLDVDLSS